MEKKRCRVLTAAGIFCVLIGASTVFILVVTLVDFTDIKCQSFYTPSQLYFTRSTDTLTVSWNHAWPNIECGVSYKLQYAIDNRQPEEVLIKGNSYNIPSQDVCFSVEFRLWAVHKSGKENTNVTIDTYNAGPKEAVISDIEFLPTEEGLLVTWSRPAALQRCLIYYNVDYDTDLADLGTQYVQTNFGNIVIPDDMYCFKVSLNISLYVFDRFIGGSVTSKTFYNWNGISELQATQSREDLTQMLVTWAKNPRHDICHLKYTAFFIYEDGTATEIDVGENLSIKMTAKFCAPFELMIETFSRLISRTLYTTETMDIVYPTRISGAINLTLLQDEGRITIFWTNLQNLDNCEVNHKIKLTTDLDTFSIETSATSYKVPDDYYCLFLEFEVVTVVGDYSSEPAQSELFTFYEKVLHCV